ncbi:phage tail tape measure protein [Candidatus Bacteroides intestinigallinarum]|jgi:TP901 family phage tail tape measure protein|uniref:phage tail tape measure protein n=1 Tax=Candidatus Bacteroides intestinigallinarum TaxID=2838470 RepID=UPI00205206D9|nr:phage tail tape measure protein [Candidatus Bacteroides intestinigallinarum]MCS3176958.1 phage tail tape measure protein [Candidatus Bacteroides intestinigallinarum]DAJ40726.1 MAG TPA: minor tail protein [Caudoviricetes sp.]
MANELKITDVVDQKAITQLQNLKKEIDESYTSYKNFIELLAKGMQDKPASFQDLSNKSANYNKVLNELITTQNKLADLQKEHETLLQRIAQQTKENAAQILAEARANDLNAAAELKAQKAKTEELKQQKLINQERKKTKYTIEEGIAALNMEVKTMKDAEEQNKILRSARKQLDLTTEEGRKTVERFNSVIDRNTTFLKKNSDQLVQAKMNVGRYKQDIQSAASEILKGNISLKNMGNLAKSTGGLLKSSMGVGLTEVRVGVGSMIKGMVGAQAVISGFQKLIGLFKSGVQSIVDFEAANSKLAAILGTTSNNIKDMTADARRLGAATKYTAAEATNLQIELAKLGFSRKEILQSTEGILKFAQATGADLPEAAALAGAALRMFDAETRETERYVSAMAVATTKSALSFSYLQTAMPIVGPVAKAFNFQIEDTLALLGKLADAGFDASMSATATRNILLNLADGSGKLAKALGGPVNTLPELVAGLKKLKEQGVDLNTTLELTDKRSVAAFNAFLTAADKIVPLREQITGVTGELNDMANTMGDNVQGAVANLESAWEAFMLSFYESKGVMKEVIDFLSKGIRNIADSMKDYDQLQEDANNRAVANAQSEMAQSDILERHRNNMSKLYEEKIKEGMSADKAAIAAKEEYLQTLQSQLDIENKEYSDGIKKRENLEKEIEDRGLFRKGTIYGWLYDKTSIGRTKKVIEEDIKTATTAAAGKKAIASITESIIDDLNKVDLKQVEVSQNTLGKNLTDKELRELEKQRKERLRIQQEYQQSELDLMDEGLGKELAKIRLNYTKRIAAVKGNTQEEIKTRENLAVAMEDELSEKIYTYNQNKEKINLQNRLEALSTNSKDELDQRLSIQLQVNEILRDAEVKAAKKAGEDVEAVNKKYDKKASDIAVKNALERIGLIEKNTTKETNIVQNAAENDLRKEELRYRKGEINEKEYRQKVYEITKDSIQEQLKLLNIQLQAELAALDPTNAKSDEIKKKIETVKAEIKKLNNEIEDLTYGKEKSDRQDWADGFIDAMSNMRGVAEDYLGDTVNLFSSFYNIIGKLTDEFVETGNFSLSKWWENLDPKEKAAVILETYASLFDGITSIVTSAFDARIEQIEEEQEKNEKAGEEEIERIEKLAEDGAISTEEAEARKRAAEQATADKNKELEKQKAELEQRQAKWQKANSIVQTTIATSLAIMQAFAQAGPIAGPILAAVIAAMGAAQVAIIASQPIPKYAKGTKDHPGGLAIVGDGGRQEVIETDNGAYITPSVPTLVDIPKRAKVIPNLVDYRKMSLHSDALMLDRQRRSNDGEPVIVNVNNDYTRLERKFDDLYGESRKTNRTLRKISRASDMRSILRRL